VHVCVRACVFVCWLVPFHLFCYSRIMYTHHAHASCKLILHTAAHASCTRIMYTHHAHAPCALILHTAAHTSCTLIMHTHHAHEPCTRIMHTALPPAETDMTDSTLLLLALHTHGREALVSVYVCVCVCVRVCVCVCFRVHKKAHVQDITCKGCVFMLHLCD
jgi:hypothetical protein